VINRFIDVADCYHDIKFTEQAVLS